MTTPPPQPVDPANDLLAECPAKLITAIGDTAGGQRMALTIRTPSTTLTVMLGGADAKAWAAQLTRDASTMSGSGLVVAQGRSFIPHGPNGSG